MTIQIKANFNKQSKDSKKELIQFYVKGEDENKPDLNRLCREVVEIQIEGIEQKLTAEFNKASKDSKKTVLDFIVKGGTSSDQSYQFYQRAGSDVNLLITESQMSIDEFYDDEHEGIEYSVDGNGNVEVDENQLSLDDLPVIPEADEEPQNDIEKAKNKRKTKAEKEAEANAAAQAMIGDDEDSLLGEE